jgi:AraC-like DNA-binding protein
MRLYVKNMVSNRCKMILKSELEKFGLHYIILELGEVDIMEEVSPEKRILLNTGLQNSGLALIEDKKSILIEKIKNAIIELVHYSESQLKENFSVYLSEKLNHDYTYLSNIFSENQDTTIAHFLLMHKIERAKELLIYDELNITEIADKLHYSSVCHFSNQFKKLTGLTPSQYKHLKNKRRKSLESL